MSCRPHAHGEGLALARAASVAVLLSLLLSPWSVLAGPTGGQVVAGSGTIQRPNVDTTVIQQQSQSLSIDWTGFDVAGHELVSFQQPSASSAVLNRVFNELPSQIHGRIQANGQVFIMNPNGVVFGPGARVEVGGLMASSLDIDVDDFMSGLYRFSAGDPQGSGMVVNHGLIKAASGGVTLLGGAVSNDGVIIADVGHVLMGAGRQALVDFDGDGLIRFHVDGAVLKNLAVADGDATTAEGQALDNHGSAVVNNGEIRADGGQVLLSAAVAREIFDSAINNTGIIRAASIDHAPGVVRLSAAGGSVENSGTIDVSAAGAGAGGTASLTSDVDVLQHGQIHADAGAGDGGSVILESAGVTRLDGSASVSARSAVARGGEVRVLGDAVALLDSASIDVSGGSGGGTVLVGGDYQGADLSIANAGSTEVAPQVRVTADATERGDGGRVIVWSNETTEYYGTISARGGPSGGDGGFAEVSGKRSLTYRGSTDLSAANGSRGTLLLDPEFLLIVGGSGDGDGDGFDTQFAGGLDSSVAGSILFTDAGPSIIYQSEIEAQSATANIALQATGLIFTTGSFTNDALTLAPDSNLLIESRNTSSGSGGFGSGIINLTTSSQGENLDIVTSGSGTITVTSGGGDKQNTAIYLPNLLSDADIFISAGGGPSSSVQVLGTVSGASISVDATGLVSVMDGARLVAGGSGTTLQVAAGGITLHDGAPGVATVSNSGTGAVTLTSTGAADIELGEHAIAIGAGALSLDSARDIIALHPTDTTNTRNEINSAGALTLRATRDIGDDDEFIEIGGVADLMVDVDDGNFYISGSNSVGGAGRALSSLSLRLSPEDSGEYVLDNFAGQTFDFTQGNFGDNLVIRDISSASALDLSITTREHGIVIGGSGAEGIQLAGASNVSLDSHQGIEEAADDDAGVVSAEITTDGRLTLVAANNIGANGLLDVAAGSGGVSALEATADTGVVRVNGIDALRIEGEGIKAAGGGALQSSRALTVAADVNTGAGMSFSATNDSARAGNDVNIVAGAVISLDSAGAGTLRFNAGDNIAFDDGRVETGGANGQRVELLADGERGGSDGVVGQVTQSGAGVSVAAGHLSIASGAGIGAGAALQTAVATLTADNSTAGDVNIANRGDLLILGSLRNDASGAALSLSNDNGALNTGLADVASAGGALTLEARESDATPGAGDRAHITVGPGGLRSAGGAIAVRAADGVTMNGPLVNDGGDVAIGAGLASLEANADGIGDLRISTSLDTGNGELSLRAGSAIEQLSGRIRSARLHTDSGGTTTLNHPDNAIDTLQATAGGDVVLTNSVALNIGSSDVGGDFRIDNAQAVQVVDRVEVAGTLSVTTAAGGIEGGAGGLVAGGGLALDAAEGIGADTVLETQVSGNMSLRSRGAGARGNIVVHQQGDLATSQITLLTTDTASAQKVALSAGNVLTVDKDPVDSPNLQDGDTLELDANRIALAGKISGSGVDVRFKAPVDVTGASVFINLDQSLLTFDENVSPGANTILAIRSDVVFASGHVTGKPGSTLVISDTLNLATDTTIEVDNLQLSGDPASLTGNGNLTLLPATHGGNIVLGGGSGLAPDVTLATLQGFGGGRALSIGVPGAPTATSPYAGNVTVNSGLNVGDAVLTVGGLGDVSLNNHGDPLQSERAINIVAIGDRRVFPGLVMHKGGDIVDTNANAGAPATLKAPEVNVIAQGRVGVASNALEVEVGPGGNANFVTGASNAFINTVPGGESVTNVAGVSVLLAAFQSLGFFSDTLNQAALGRTVGLETTGLETTGLGELLYVDEGLYLLPQPYATPIQASLLPALADPDFPGNRRPDDPDDEEGWQQFFNGVLKDYVQSRYPVPPEASAEQRAASEARMQREWQSLVDYFQKIRGRERAAILTGSPLGYSSG